MYISINDFANTNIYKLKQKRAKKIVSLRSLFKVEVVILKMLWML